MAAMNLRSTAYAIARDITAAQRATILAAQSVLATSPLAGKAGNCRTPCSSAVRSSDSAHSQTRGSYHVKR